MTETNIQTIQKRVEQIGFVGKNLISISDLTDKQLYGLFELALALEPWNRSKVDILKGNLLVTLFFQPSTRTRMSFETAMLRLGGDVVSEPNPLVSSSAAKEESLNDTMRVVSQYANIIVLRHPDADEAEEGVSYAESPVISGGFGHREHPTQALLDLYTLWRTYGRVEGLKICIASPDLVKARTGHSMAKGLARLGAKVYLASLGEYRTPDHVMQDVRTLSSDVEEVCDQTQDEFNTFALDMDLIYLPGCSAPAGTESDAFKKMMEPYVLRYDTIKEAFDKGQRLYVTHTLPRRAGEMDLRIDYSPGELMFKAIAYSVSIRSALILSILGA
ncbi:aspartate carbamoyltransferase [candidate division KSB3 bacterium]|uniref:Aspartate carbamoyltransferase n=1 Tax=candidate division KSB3 bacterium TaxID=2044937 RepID=A0A9D5Q5U0_9BACT|nr:aspartate carbamoyltransferase [candidate division KSB3 bacterium]MBD3324597.1 aspartate carbamoyltransferase [candidate division KSB3 bacterium]